MRDFTPFESACILRGACPSCGGLAWLQGPRGGASVNLECARCGMRVNVCPEIPGWGQVIRGPTLFVCPQCGASSSNPTDLAEGYCNRCHEWTGKR